MKHLFLFFTWIFCTFHFESLFGESKQDLQKDVINYIVTFYEEDWFEGKRIVYLGENKEYVNDLFFSLGAYVRNDLPEDLFPEDFYDMIILFDLLNEIPEIFFRYACDHCKDLIIENSFQEYPSILLNYISFIEQIISENQFDFTFYIDSQNKTDLVSNDPLPKLYSEDYKLQNRRLWFLFKINSSDIPKLPSFF